MGSDYCPKIEKWSELQDEFQGENGGNLLVGNGASIAMHDGFSYKSLYEEALKKEIFDENVSILFKKFCTNDFELVMRMLWYSYVVNKALDIDNLQITTKYKTIRDGLINVLQLTHCKWTDVQNRLNKAIEFCKSFSTIFSLNYDLIIYWIMQQSNSSQTCHKFKDCFYHGVFDHQWQRFRDKIKNEEKVTLVFWPHGNLILADHKLEGERKLHANDNQLLLDTVFDKWKSNEYKPIFVSEGKSLQKLRSIKRSEYLSSVLFDVIPSISDSLVIYGWSMGENDQHIVDAIAKNSNIRKLAVSIYEPDENAKHECPRIESLIHKTIDQDRRNIDIRFFDSSDNKVWSY